MPGNFKDEDVRVQKTKEALTAAMTTLLTLRNFNKITVNDLCKEAKVGRTTFYYHYKDKYDLLKYWLSKTKSEIIPEKAKYKNIGKRINDFANSSDKITRHLIENADTETFGLLCDFTLSLLGMDKTDNEQISPKHIVLSKFCCGGIMDYLQWQASDTLRTDYRKINSYFYDILNTLYKWNKEHK